MWRIRLFSSDLSRRFQIAAGPLEFSSAGGSPPEELAPRERSFSCDTWTYVEEANSTKREICSSGSSSSVGEVTLTYFSLPLLAPLPPSLAHFSCPLSFVFSTRSTLLIFGEVGRFSLRRVSSLSLNTPTPGEIQFYSADCFLLYRVVRASGNRIRICAPPFLSHFASSLVSFFFPFFSANSILRRVARSRSRVNAQNLILTVRLYFRVTFPFHFFLSMSP